MNLNWKEKEKIVQETILFTVMIPIRPEAGQNQDG